MKEIKSSFVVVKMHSGFLLQIHQKITLIRSVDRMMKRMMCFILAFALLVVPITVSADEQISNPISKSMYSEKADLNYLITFPKGYDANAILTHIMIHGQLPIIILNFINGFYKIKEVARRYR